MPNYDQFKKAWNSMWNAERRKYTEQYKNDAQFQQFAQQYSQEMKNTGTQWSVNQNLNTNTNQWTNTQQWVVNNQNQTNANGGNWGNTQKPDYFSDQYITDNSEEAKAARARGLQNMQDQQNQTFDFSKLTNPNAQVSVKEWTAAQTWLPDYQDNSDAREQEIVNNLNAYWNTNKSFFTDRATFNSTFHYDERNDRQKAILDSFWKGTENYNKATSYTDWKSFNIALNSWNITEAQYAGMKDWNPEVFKEWQDQLKEEMNLAISNLSKITTNYDNAEILQSMVEKLWIQPQQWRDIIGWWEEMMDRTWAWSAMKDATDAREKYNWVADEMTRITKKYSSSTWGNQSDALVAARLQKALAPYQQQAQNYYSAWQMANTEFQTKLGTANNYASVIQSQAAEDQRIFQQKLTSLGFAMQVNSYRTPEQQAALQLQTQQIQNNMTLYQQSRLNELSLYNQKQLNDLNLQFQEEQAKLKNKLESELTDLNVSDENQLRANLNRALSAYYEQYWDIIKRSQAQVVDDVIAYAKKNNCSIGEALTKNFIEPLQNKPEYRNKINQNYWMYGSQSLWTIGWNDVVITKNPDWTMNFRYLGNTQANNLSQGLANFVLDHPVDTKWGQCWSFVNDYLEDLWLGRLFWNEYSQKQSLKNTDVATVWSIAIMPSSKSPKNWHVAVVTSINNEKWTVTVVESNWWWDEKVHTREVKMSDIYWYYAPSIDWWWVTYSWWYNSSRVPAYERYLKDWTYPTDAKLKSMWNWDLQKWMQLFESEVASYSNEKWVDYYSPEAKKEITNLRKEFNSLPDVKEFRDVQNSYNKILTASNWTAAWDMSMIFAYMKMLDPGSVVREWEFANAQNSAGIPDRIRNAYNNALNWTRLSEKQRDEFLDVAKWIYQSYVEKYNKLLAEYQWYIVEWWDPNWIWQFVTIGWTYKTGALQELVKWWTSDTQWVDALINRWRNI